MKIFIVDDGPEITSLYRKALDGGEISVDTYNDPSQPYQISKIQYYDISLIIVRIPGMGGFDLYK